MTVKNPYFNNHIFRGNPTGDIIYGEEESDTLSGSYDHELFGEQKSKKALPRNVSATIAAVLRHIGG